MAVKVTNNTKSPAPLPCGVVVPPGQSVEVPVLDTGIPIIAAWVRRGLLSVEPVKHYQAIADEPAIDPVYPALYPDSPLLSE